MKHTDYVDEYGMIDMIAIERDARILRAQAFASGIRKIGAWLRSRGNFGAAVAAR
ncbi:RSP_7527 family protein [Pacificitalea manganoxidans]|uniref:RSP_7527 family protein n=1 Tax=Pacificitalea manganoxidans TaxID=1411902 RepID=UPI0012FD1711|nr:hypothetical protein [Pacificitalea manganoxidans]MDR6307881.1 hypothetical protein [Pacificitalea manganoxidans]|tara:strand:+ start:896 stop:1060 length:165 start_codon:yes stop_codon:yes gene_type:complete